MIAERLTIRTLLRTFIRYAAAFIMLGYGFAKINGSQFTVLDAQLDKPMGQASGFWLTWYFFGYSPFYGTFIAMVEIVGALLLTFRRTTLLGACILAAVLANVILIDICYGVDGGAIQMAVLLFAGMLVLIAPHAREILGIFWRDPSGVETPVPVRVAAWFVRAAMVVIMAGFTYWVANFNNRAPTPIDGTWNVVQVTPAELSPRAPQTFFFEYNRMHMTVFKTAEGVYTTHHFELDRSSGHLGMWETWLTKGKQIFDGGYQLAGEELRLSGTLEGAGQVALRLHKRSVR